MQKAKYVLFFIIGIAVVMTIDSAHIANFWTLQIFDVVRNLSLIQALKPIIVPEPVNFYLFRPVTAIIFSIYSKIFDFNLGMLYLSIGLAIGAFGVVIYKFNLKFGAESNKAYLSSIFSIISPVIIFSIYPIIDIEIFGTIFVYLSLLLFINIKNKKSKYSIITFLLFILLSSIAIFTKETSLIFLIVMLITYIFVQKDKINKLQILGFLLILMLVSFSFLSVLKSPLPYEKKFPTLSYMPFVAIHNAVQLMYLIAPISIFILTASSITLFLKNKFEYFKLGLIILLFAFVIFTPVLVSFSMFGMVFFSSSSFTIPILCVLLIISLCIKYAKSNGLAKFYPLCILMILTAVTTITLFIPSVRPDVSSRIYMTSLPLLAFLVIESFFSLWKKFKKNNIILGILLFCIVMLIYYPFASMLNLTNENRAQAITEYETKINLADLNLSGSTVFFTDVMFPVYKLDLKALANKDVNAQFMFLNSHNALNSMDEIKREACTKISQTQQDHGKIFVYDLRKNLISSSQNVVQGDFKWTENDTFSILAPTEDFMETHWLRDYGLIQSYQKTVYSNQTLLEQFLQKENATIVYNYETEYYQISPWLEDIVSRSIKGVPYLMKYKYVGTIYYLDLDKLDCHA